MIVLVQSIPNYVEGVTPERAEVATQAELFATPWVARYANDIVDGEVTRRFHRWSISEYGLPTPMLMAEHSAGTYWWAVGFIRAGRELLDLPKWERKP